MSHETTPYENTPQRRAATKGAILFGGFDKHEQFQIPVLTPEDNSSTPVEITQEADLPSFAELNSDEQALAELEEQVQSHEDRVTLDEFKRELAGIALAKADKSEETRKKILSEQEAAREPHWTSTGPR